jgi:cysteinyl-tRNA synthetase
VPEELSQYRARVLAALEDDLNLPVALAATADMLKQVNELCERTKGKQKVPRAAVQAAREAFEVLGRVLGLGTADAQPLLDRIRARRAARLGLSEADVQAKIDARIAARQARDFAAADRARDELAALGVELMDGPTGTTWRIG